MAHEITIRKDGKVEAAFAMEKPWHGLGILTPELMDPAEALRLANMDWTVSLSPIQTIQEFGGVRMDAFRAVIRDDNLLPLGIVSKGYKPVQNAEQVDIIRTLIGEGLSVSACGTLFDGKKSFWTCRVPENLILSDGDSIERYLILSNGHDGMTSLQIYWSPIRVVCNNTLMASLRGITTKVSIKHTQNVSSRIEEARAVLGLAQVYYSKLGESFNVMKSKPMDVDQFINSLLYPVFEVKEEEKKEIGKRKMEKFEKVIDNFESAAGHEGTVFGGYNAITYFTSHQQVTDDLRGKDANERRFESVTKGVGKEINDRAYTRAMELCA